MTGSLVAALRRRLVLVGLLLTAVNIAVITFYYVDWQGLRHEKVEEQAAAIGRALSRGPDGALAVGLSPAQARMFRQHPQAYGFRVQDEAGKLLAEANSAVIPLGVAVTEPPKTLRKVSFSGEGTAGVVAVTQRVRVGGVDVFVTFASTADDPEGLTTGVFLDELLGHVVLPLVPFALLLTLVNLWTVRRSLASLTGAAAAANRINADGGLQPLPVEGLPTEVRMLVDATNAALARLGSALETERAFTAEAAHALRTPLAILAARINAFASGNEQAAIRTDIEAMTRLVNQMLSAAQADALVIEPGSVCDLAQVARDVVSAMAPLALREGRSLAVEGPDKLPMRGDADALAHALRSLLENALRHAPIGSEVVVELDPAGGLAVLDRGPGIPESEKPLATRRFWRGPRTSGSGAGLGLSIAARIAAAHGGILVISDREGGGASVALALPRE